MPILEKVVDALSAFRESECSTSTWELAIRIEGLIYEVVDARLKEELDGYKKNDD